MHFSDLKPVDCITIVEYYNYVQKGGDVTHKCKRTCSTCPVKALTFTSDDMTLTKQILEELDATRSSAVHRNIAANVHCNILTNSALTCMCRVRAIVKVYKEQLTPYLFETLL